MLNLFSMEVLRSYWPGVGHCLKSLHLPIGCCKFQLHTAKKNLKRHFVCTSTLIEKRNLKKNNKTVLIGIFLDFVANN
jgi:hypothetical protein